jgi:hypothetical protein
VNLEVLQPGRARRALEYPGETCRRERVPALRQEDERRPIGLATKSPQRPKLRSGQGMRGGRTSLYPPDVKHRALEVDLVPPQVDELRHPQAMTVRHEDHGRVPMTPPVRSGGDHQPLDLRIGEVLAGPEIGIGFPDDCSLFGSWVDDFELGSGQGRSSGAIAPTLNSSNGSKGARVRASRQTAERLSASRVCHRSRGNGSLQSVRGWGRHHG